MREWQPIETAPKDGTVVLGFDPEGVEVDEHTCTWPEESMLRMFPMRWCEPSHRAREVPGWYAPWFTLSFGPYDDPSTDYYAAEAKPTHWMPLPEPPPTDKAA